MKIGIDIRSTLKQKTGIGYYTLNLINSLAKIDSETLYFLYSYIRPFDFKRHMPELPGHNFCHRLDRLSFRPDIRMGDMDAFHTSSYDIPKLKDTKLVTTIHDIIPLVYSEGYAAGVLKRLERDIRRVLDESDLIIVDSNSTKKDLENKFFPKKRIETVYPGRDESFLPMKDKKEAINFLKENYGIDKEFILFVGTIEKRKNVAGLVQAFFDLKKEKRIPHLLVIIGMKGWGGKAAFDLVENADLKREVRFIGYIPRKDLMLFYNAADLFVYPSSYEGFGLPILEAFSCGVPVVTSSTTSCGEIAGEAAMTIDPQDVNVLKGAIDKVLNNRNLREELRTKGFNRADLFSWNNTAKQFQKIFYEL